MLVNGGAIMSDAIALKAGWIFIEAWIFSEKFVHSAVTDLRLGSRITIFHSWADGRSDCEPQTSSGLENPESMAQTRTVTFLRRPLLRHYESVRIEHELVDQHDLPCLVQSCGID